MKPNGYDPIAAALKEDIGDGDVTTESFVSETLHSMGRIIARENAVVAGTGAAAEVFRQVDPSTVIEINCRDGDNVAQARRGIGLAVGIISPGKHRSVLSESDVMTNSGCDSEHIC